jgi:hypothetical protein
MPKHTICATAGGGHQDFIHLARADLLAAAVDDFLEPPGDGDVVLGVFRALVAGAEPAV